MVGLGSITAALSLAGIGTAHADGGDQCGQLSIEHSQDGGQSWSTGGRIDGGTAPAKITVRLKGDVGKGCEYAVSLASYSAEGATWDTSGTQAFLGWDTTKLTGDNREHTLDVSAFAPSCFGQIDLYGNGNKYDGSDQDHALPHYPDSLTPPDLITAWNGGSPCTTASPSPSDSTTASPSPSDTASSSPSESPTDTTSPSPSDSPTDTGSPSPSDTGSPSPSDTATSTAPVADTSSPASPTAGSTAPPVGTPVVKPASDTTASSSGDLAETGGNSSQTVAFAAGGAALLVVGGGAVVLTRRRNRTAGR
jgi:LPXTG-motif cell wall-anchored protein